jgi:hypothetical protein
VALNATLSPEESIKEWKALANNSKLVYTIKVSVSTVGIVHKF